MADERPVKAGKVSAVIQILLGVGILVLVVGTRGSWSWMATVPLGIVGVLLGLSGVGLLLPDRPSAATSHDPVPRPRSITMDDATVASNAGAITLSLERLALFHPYLSSGDARAHPEDAAIFAKIPRELALTALSEHLQLGDCRGAEVAVVTEDTPVVAAYTDNFDACVYLATSGTVAKTLIARHGLVAGTRLLTVNTFTKPRPDGGIQGDIVRGSRYQGSPWSGVWPLIADFLCDDPQLIAERHASISEAEWQRLHELAQAAQDAGSRLRPLRPFLSRMEGRLVPPT